MSDGPARPPTLVGRLMASGPAVALMSLAPVPLWLVRAALARDNAKENRRDNWNRLRDGAEAARYDGVRATTERYAEHGFVLDIGCSQGILQEGLRYGRYLGIDQHAPSIAYAAVKRDAHTDFRVADAESFVAPTPPNAVVLNEVIYYLADPVTVVRHYADQVAPGGVVVVSVFARTWSSRRLLRQLGRQLEPVESATVVSGHLAWTIAVFRPGTAEARITPS